MDKPSDHDSNQEERRGYFRLEDKVTLEYEVLDAHNPVTDPYSPTLRVSPLLKMTSELHSLEMDAHHLLKPLRDGNRALGQYLENINKRIDCLAKYIVAESSRGNQKPTHDVSISEGGVSFETSCSIEEGSRVHLKIGLFPSMHGISAIAKCTYCSERGPQTRHKTNFRVGMEFTHILESDRQVLAKHIIQEQSRQRREKITTSPK